MRSIYRLLLAATVSALLSACSGPQPRDGGAAQETPPTATTEPPAVALSPKLLYQLLVAEFSGQQGALRLSAATYLDAAEQTRDHRLAQRATHIAIYAREHATALKAAQLWVELDAGNPEAHKSIASLLIVAGLHEEARPHLERLLQLGQGGEEQGFLLVATLLANDPDKGRALDTMAQLAARAPDSAEALYAQAHLAHQLEQHEQARGVVARLLKGNPDHHQGLILQARILQALGDEQGALKSTRRALQLTPDNTQLRLTYARMLVDAHQLKEARHQFTALHKSSPDDGDVLYALGLLAQEAGDLDEAEQRYQQLLEQHQREEESRLALGQIAEARKQFDRAIEWYSSVAQGEHYLDAQLQAARLIASHRTLGKARDYLHELETQNDEERVRLLLAEGELLNDANDHQAAMAVYDEGLNRYKEHNDLLYARALTAEQLGRVDILERDLKRILKGKPDDAHALNALGYTLVDRTERLEEGYGYIERAYRQRPEDVAILDSMGWALYRLGRVEEALGYLQRAAAKLRDGEISAHLGEVLWASGRKEEARQVWEKALEFAPDHKVLLETIRRHQP